VKKNHITSCKFSLNLIINSLRKAHRLPLNKGYIKFAFGTRRQWLILAILATQEAEVRRIVVRGQPEQILPKPLSQKNPSHT
jgi:hypothetical protein